MRLLSSQNAMCTRGINIAKSLQIPRQQQQMVAVRGMEETVCEYSPKVLMFY